MKRKITIAALTLGLLVFGIISLPGSPVSNTLAATARQVPPAPQHKGFAVIELFTSEGCSSCPAADELVADIQKENAGKQIYVLAFHVDYWDRQGWKDRFSNHDFTERQQRYSGWLNLSTIYTPQVVINGATEYVGSDAPHILKAVSGGLDQDPANNLTIDCGIVGKRLTVNYRSTATEKGDEVLLALVRRSAQSAVRGGENAGLKLSHVQIVQQLVHAKPVGKGPVAIDLPPDFNPKEWQLIGLVQNSLNGHISAATKFDF
ncbi:MAG: DUF1223 domain-containing protein [Bacteroidetes bacterium]|nr:DUF1223 domain-containing protein [Bacteroidota bacterium]